MIKIVIVIYVLMLLHLLDTNVLTILRKLFYLPACRIHKKNRVCRDNMVECAPFCLCFFLHIFHFLFNTKFLVGLLSISNQFFLHYRWDRKTCKCKCNLKGDDPPARQVIFYLFKLTTLHIRLWLSCHFAATCNVILLFSDVNLTNTHFHCSLLMFSRKSNIFHELTSLKRNIPSCNTWCVDFKQMHVEGLFIFKFKLCYQISKFLTVLKRSGIFCRSFIPCRCTG